MELFEEIRNQQKILIIKIDKDEILVPSVQAAIALAKNLKYQYSISRLVLPAETFIPEFFDLKTNLCDELLQDFMNHQIKLAVVDDSKHFEKQSLHDFINEKNYDHDFFLVSTIESAIEHLAKV